MLYEALAREVTMLPVEMEVPESLQQAESNRSSQLTNPLAKKRDKAGI